MNEWVYLNHASTSNQKPEATQKAIMEYLCGDRQWSAGRNLAQMDQNHLIWDTRVTLADFFGAKNPKQVIFTSGVTLSLNMILWGLLGQGDHVITTSLEHNAVARPLDRLKEERGIEVSYLACGADGALDPEELRPLIRANTKVLVMTHASNVTGAILPYWECFAIAKEYGIITVLDTAQTAGYCQVHLEDSPIDVLAFTGHKGLWALAGVGGFVVRPEIAGQMKTLICGGTGSSSHSTRQPERLPDKFESGTPNGIGILSLRESVKVIEQLGLDNIRAREEILTQRFLHGLEELPVTHHGTKVLSKTVPTVSITCGDRDCALLSQQLFERYGIVTRSGLHCAPLAHQSIGTYPQGTLRFSFGYHTTVDEIEYSLSALRSLLG
ncbi:MAG: aminotransferase class V-fold PLP-dependent enzyme [Clostridiales bacterium]|nr:aminotransferase class V-fold PLP-dependent enzyme [Clostridiales bacterium]